LRVKVFITPKTGILDPQGKAVEHALAALGFTGVASVRVGKYLELELAAQSTSEATITARAMCEQLLANTLIEDYRLEVDGA